MKAVKVIYLIVAAVLGLAGIAAALEEFYNFSYLLLISNIFFIIAARVVLKAASSYLDTFESAGNLLWFLSGVYVLLWKLFFSRFGIVGTGAAFIYVASGLIWYSKNIIKDRTGEDYSGLYLPAAAGFILSTALLFKDAGVGLYRVLALIVLLSSYLMITDIKYFNFARTKTGRIPLMLSVTAASVIIVTVFFSAKVALFGLFTAYAFSGVAGEIKSKVIKHGN